MKEFIGRVILLPALCSTSLNLSSAGRWTQAFMSLRGTSESLVSTESGAFSLGVFAFSPFAGLDFLAFGESELREALPLAAWERAGLFLFLLLLRSDPLGVGGELTYWSGTGD